MRESKFILLTHIILKGQRGTPSFGVPLATYIYLNLKKFFALL